MFKGQTRIGKGGMDRRLQGGVSHQTVFFSQFRHAVSALFSLVDLRDECEHCALLQTSKSDEEIGLRDFLLVR